MARSGQLNKLITLQAKAKVADAYGGATVTWTDVGSNIWAAIWSTSAKERSQAMQETMTISHRIRIRYRSSFSQAWRISYGGNFYNIVSILNPNMHNEYLDLMCKEVAQ